jgi:hypothetical protein
VLLRLVHEEAALVDLKMPPSLPVQTVLVLLGSISMACESACRPVCDAVKVGVPRAFVTFVRMCALPLSPGPPR